MPMFSKTLNQYIPSTNISLQHKDAKLNLVQALLATRLFVSETQCSSKLYSFPPYHPLSAVKNPNFLPSRQSLTHVTHIDNAGTLCIFCIVVIYYNYYYQHIRILSHYPAHEQENGRTKNSVPRNSPSLINTVCCILTTPMQNDFYCVLETDLPNTTDAVCATQNDLLRLDEMNC